MSDRAEPDIVDQVRSEIREFLGSGERWSAECPNETKPRGLTPLPALGWTHDADVRVSVCALSITALVAIALVGAWVFL